MIKIYWDAIKNWGNHLHDDPDKRLINTITNVGGFFALLLYGVDLISLAIVSYILLQIDYNLYFDTVVYVDSFVLLLSILSGLVVYLKNRTSHVLLYSNIFILLSVVINGGQSLLISPSLGYHWVLLATIPLTYISNGYNKKLFFIFGSIPLIAFLFILYWLDTYQAPFTVPAYFRQYSFTILKLSGIVIVTYGLFYIGLREGLWQFLKKKWLSWCDLGEENYFTQEEKKSNQISNHIFLLFICIAILVFIINSSLAIRAILLDRRLLLSHLSIYSGGSFLITFLVAIIFSFKIRSTRAIVFEVAAYGLALFFISLTALCMGANSHYQYSLAPLILNPLFFSKGSWQFRFFMMSFVPILIAITIWLQSLTGVLYPLPPSLTQELQPIITAFVFTSLVLQFFYIYWKYNFKKKFLALWRYLSDYGNNYLTSETEKKFNVLTNQIILFFGIQMAILLAAGIFIIFNLLLPADFNRYINHAIWLLPPVALAVALFSFIFYFRHRFATKNLGKFILFSYGLLLLGYLSVCLGRESNFHILILTCISLPLLGISKEDYKSIIGTEVILLIILSAIYILQNFITVPFFLPISILKPISYIINLDTFVSLMIIAYYFWNESRRTEEVLIQEQNKSEKLLLNILPASVAEKLMLNGHFDPVDYEGASVLFTDFVGFTKVAETMTPKELTEELDRCFSYFDSVIDHYNLEKLKTIGDSYMAAGGLPIANHTHAFDTILAALEIQNFMNQMKTIKESQNLPYWQLRLGINSGPLVAGVIGKSKFAYDIWGETVKVASRMESFGLSGKINISEHTYEQVKFVFDCKYRGLLKKGKLQPEKMYLIEGLKSRYSIDGNHSVPNQEFKDIYNKIKKLIH